MCVLYVDKYDTSFEYTKCILSQVHVLDLCLPCYKDIYLQNKLWKVVTVKNSLKTWFIYYVVVHVNTWYLLIKIDKWARQSVDLNLKILTLINLTFY